jgi:hypothetical protein
VDVLEWGTDGQRTVAPDRESMKPIVESPEALLDNPNGSLHRAVDFDVREKQDVVSEIARIRTRRFGNPGESSGFVGDD